jgi:hypothetical protein
VWSDVIGTDPAAIPAPQGHDRHYVDLLANDSYNHDILPFKNAGIDIWVAPDDVNSRQVYQLNPR